MPLPRVTKPVISSGGAGLQHLASCVIKSSKPTTSTPPLPTAPLFACALTQFASAAGLVGSAGAWLLNNSSKLCAVMSSRPKAKYSSSVLAKPKFCAMSSCLTAVLLRRCNSFSNTARPCAMYSTVAWALNHARTLLFARGLLVKPSRSQSREGPPCLTAMMLTVWPVCNLVVNGTI